MVKVSLILPAFLLCCAVIFSASTRPCSVFNPARAVRPAELAERSNGYLHYLLLLDGEKHLATDLPAETYRTVGYWMEHRLKE